MNTGPFEVPDGGEPSRQHKVGPAQGSGMAGSGSVTPYWLRGGAAK
ncbi:MULTISPECIES: hypothetical protein [unclassified Streptomyces]|nr:MULTISPECIES: hypothetical protein [unclassified Streptomyces]